MLTWLQDHSAAVAALSSLVLTVITGYYVYLARRLLKENQEIRLAATRPELAIYIRPDEGEMSFVILCIENVGPGPAYDVTFTTNVDFKNGQRSPLRGVGPFRQGLTYFPPHHKIEHFLTSVIGKLDDLKKQPLEIVANYRDTVGGEYTRSFLIDFGELENLSRIGTPPLHDIAKAVKALQQDVNQISTGFRKPRILTEPAHHHDRGLEADYLTLRLRRLSEQDLIEVTNLLEEKEAESRTAHEDPSATEDSV